MEEKQTEPSYSKNNKRIAKNTLMLYFRMMLIMSVMLYTSRVVLGVLGVEDFGIYNVVGGVIVMFGFLNTAMSSATQRFLTFELGRRDYTQLKKVFSISVTIHALIAIATLLLAETIGLWFLNTKLTIPLDRIGAANWVYQFSIYAFMVNVMAVPYNAAIISHERMSVYAYVSIFEVFIKLGIVFILQWYGFDKLKLYAILIFVASLLIRTIYRIYCKRKFEECTYRFVWDKKQFIIMLKYVSWSFYGQISVVFSNQGINMLLNMFFGPVVNAARGIAYQVIAAMNQFVANFQTSMNPQIVKYYARGEKEEMFSLVFQGSRFSFFLLLILAIPILFLTESILNIWLKNVPEYTVLFTRLVIINGLIDCLSGTLQKSVVASGKIKIYNLVIGCLLLANLPISYVLLKQGMPPYAAFYVTIIITSICLFARLIILRIIIEFPVISFFKSVLSNVLFTSLLSIILPVLFINTILEQKGIGSIIIMLILLIQTVILVYFVGFKHSEREFVKNQIRKHIRK